MYDSKIALIVSSFVCVCVLGGLFFILVGFLGNCIYFVFFLVLLGTYLQNLQAFKHKVIVISSRCRKLLETGGLVWFKNT